MNDFRNTMENKALEDVLAERMAQIEKRGHTPELDARQDPHRLPEIGKDYAQIAAERARPGAHQELPGAYRKAVQAAALMIAAAERIALEIDRQKANELAAVGVLMAPDLFGAMTGKAERRCRLCGCTEDNACVDDMGEPCGWAEPDLCTMCVQ